MIVELRGQEERTDFCKNRILKLLGSRFVTKVNTIKPIFYCLTYMRVVHFCGLLPNNRGDSSKQDSFDEYFLRWNVLFLWHLSLPISYWRKYENLKSSNEFKIWGYKQVTKNRYHFIYMVNFTVRLMTPGGRDKSRLTLAAILELFWTLKVCEQHIHVRIVRERLASCTAVESRTNYFDYDDDKFFEDFFFVTNDQQRIL